MGIAADVILVAGPGRNPQGDDRSNEQPVIDFTTTMGQLGQAIRSFGLTQQSREQGVSISGLSNPCGLLMSKSRILPSCMSSA